MQKPKIFEWLKDKFTKIDDWIEEYGNPVYNFITKLNTIIQNPELDAVVAFTKTSFDDKALEFLLLKLQWVIDQMGVLNDNDGDEAHTIAAFSEHMRGKNRNYRTAILFKMGSLLLTEFIKSDNKKPNFRRGNVDTLMQLTWEKNNSIA